MFAQAPKPSSQAPKPSGLRQGYGGQASPQALSTAGFTLLETVIATGILVTALAGIAQLFVLAMRTAGASGAHGVALVAAQAKLETLRSLQLAYGSAGERLTDPALEASPSQSLLEDTTDYFDALDEAGAVVAGEEADAQFTRRWAITPIDRREPQAVVIEVCVFRSPADGVGPVSAEACLATIRSRQP
jgi:type II secretory pathway pseudopilin PulG